MINALDTFVQTPRSPGARKLQGRENECCLRVGDWRISFRYDAPNRTIVVTHILPRGRAYRE